jgi:hypothetical protein
VGFEKKHWSWLGATIFIHLRHAQEGVFLVHFLQNSTFFLEEGTGHILRA